MINENVKCTLVVQSYGSANEYSRGIFSIISFFAWSSFELDQVQVILFTDAPSHFKRFLEDLPIVYVRLDKTKINDMRGKIDFVHRVKIIAIQKAFAYTNGDILYVDSDTCFVADPVSLMNQLEYDKVFMHKYEYEFQKMKTMKLPGGAQFHRFYNFIIGRVFTIMDGLEFTIPANQVSWNAGVIALKNIHKHYLSDVLKLTDDIFPGTLCVGCEQYAFNIILGKNLKIVSSEDYVFHYWPVVQKNITDIFLKRRIDEKWAGKSIGEKKKQVKKWTMDLQKFIDRHVLMQQYKSIQAFHENRFAQGWYFAAKSIFMDPLSVTFWNDLIYHLKRNVYYLLKSQ